MKITNVKELYKKYPRKEFYKIFYTDKQIENFKSGFIENEDGITFTGILNETINFPFGLNGNVPIGTIWPKWICRVYFTDENDKTIDAKITDYVYTINKYSNTEYKDDDIIDLDNLQNYEMMKCNKCILGELYKFNPFIYPRKCDDYNSYVKGNGNILQFVEPELQTLEMCKLAVGNRPSALKYVKEEFKQEIIDYIKELEHFNKIYDIKNKIKYYEEELDYLDELDLQEIKELKEQLRELEDDNTYNDF